MGHAFKGLVNDPPPEPIPPVDKPSDVKSPKYKEKVGQPVDNPTQYFVKEIIVGATDLSTAWQTGKQMVIDAAVDLISKLTEQAEKIKEMVEKLSEMFHTIPLFGATRCPPSIGNVNPDGESADAAIKRSNCRAYATQSVTEANAAASIGGTTLTEEQQDAVHEEKYQECMGKNSSLVNKVTEQLEAAILQRLLSVIGQIVSKVTSIIEKIFKFPSPLIFLKKLLSLVTGVMSLFSDCSGEAGGGGSTGGGTSSSSIITKTSDENTPLLISAGEVGDLMGATKPPGDTTYGEPYEPAAGDPPMPGPNCSWGLENDIVTFFETPVMPSMDKVVEQGKTIKVATNSEATEFAWFTVLDNDATWGI